MCGRVIVVGVCVCVCGGGGGGGGRGGSCTNPQLVVSTIIVVSKKTLNIDISSFCPYVLDMSIFPALQLGGFVPAHQCSSSNMLYSIWLA